MPDRSRTRSPLMQVYDQQQRFDRLASLRALARAMTIFALVILVANTIGLDRTPPRALLPRALIGAGLSIWLAAFALDYQVHSNRLNSRMIMMRLLAARTEVDEIEWDPPRSSPRAAFWVPVTVRCIDQLHAKVSQLETALEQSEHKVERALLASSTAALTSTLAIILSVAFNLAQ